MPARQISARALFAAKCVLFAALCAPAAVAAYQLPAQADPVEFIARESGITALRILALTLAVTPLRMLTGMNWLLRLRRMAGLFVFSYAAAHFSSYLLLDLQLDFSALLEDIAERKYITVGFAALVMLIPLAATSADWAVRKLGGKKWLALHKLIYAIAPLGVLHFLWIKKGEDWGEPVVYGAIVFVLLSCRLPKIKKILQKPLYSLNPPPIFDGGKEKQINPPPISDGGGRGGETQ